MSQPAGWYPQPDGTQRYWDGQAWTQHVTPAAPGATTPPNPAPVGQPAPFAAATATKVKKPIFKRVWFWVAIVVVLMIIGSMANRGGSTPTTAPAAGATSASAQAPATDKADSDDTASAEPEPSESAPAPEEKVAQIGDTVRVGDLAVTVKSAERTSKLSSVFGSKKGHWMVVTVKVENKGKDQVMVNDSDFTLKESDGTSYGTDSDGMTYIDSDKWLFLKKINPKTSATGVILFSIPKSAKNLTLQASGGLFGFQTADISLGNK